MLVVNSVTDTTSAIIYTIAANLPPKVKKASKHGQNFQCKKSFPKRAAVLTQLSCGIWAWPWMVASVWYRAEKKRELPAELDRHSRLEMTSNFIYFSFKVF